MTSRITIIMIALLLHGGVVCAQVAQAPLPPDPFMEQDGDLQRAREFEQRKEYDHALEIYERLYRMSGTDALFWQLVSLYERTGDYDAMTALVNERLESRPGELSLLRYLARAYFGRGDEDRAREVLYRIIGGRWGDQQRVYLVANELEVHGDLDGVVSLYTRARAETGDETGYAVELGNVYSTMSRYGDAVAEYLNMIELSPRSAGMLIGNIIEKNRAEGRDTGMIMAELENHLRNNPGSIETAKLLSGMKYDSGDIDDAAGILIEAAVNADAPDELWAMATRLEGDGYDETALEAYAAFSDDFPEDDRRSEALMSIADINIRAGDSDGAARNYSRVIDEYVGAEPAAVAALRMITLRRDSMSDEGYRNALSEFAGDTHHQSIAFDAYMQLADHVLRNGDFPAADDVFVKAAVKIRTPAEWYEYYRRLAFMNFYRADFDAMIRNIDQCMQYGAGEPGVNDLLELRLLARRLASPADSLTLASIGKARYSLFRGDRAAAVDSLKAVAGEAGAPFASHAAMEIGSALRTDDPPAAIEWYRTAAKAAGADSTGRVAAFMHAGDIAAQSLDGANAENYYLQALTVMNGSVYDSEIRRKLRKVMEQ